MDIFFILAFARNWNWEVDEGRMVRMIVLSGGKIYFDVFLVCLPGSRFPLSQSYEAVPFLDTVHFVVRCLGINTESQEPRAKTTIDYVSISTLLKES